MHGPVIVMYVYIIHGHPFYLVCRDVLNLVGELLSGDGCGSPKRM